MPMNTIGLCVAATAESAPPPLAWPSSLVMMTLPTFTAFLNASAWPQTLHVFRLFFVC